MVFQGIEGTKLHGTSTNMLLSKKIQFLGITNEGCTNFVCCFYLFFQFYLHNHLSFLLYFHREIVEENQEPTFRVVRFEVVPQSITVEGNNVCLLANLKKMKF